MSFLDKEVRAAFGRVLVGIRKHKNLTREVAANRSGFAVSSLLNWERGNVSLSMDNFFRLCNAFQVKPSKMVSLIEFELQRRKDVDSKTNENA